MDKKVQLKDYSGNKAFPVTKAKCVTVGNTTLDEELEDLSSRVAYNTTLNVATLKDGEALEADVTELMNIVEAGDSPIYNSTLGVFYKVSGSLGNYTIRSGEVPGTGIKYTVNFKNNAWTIIKSNRSEEISSIDKKIPSTYFVECSVGAAISGKSVRIDNFILNTNVRILVKMTNHNSADNVTLRIDRGTDSVSDIPLFYNGEQAGSKNSWDSGEILDIYYDGANYQATNYSGGNEIMNLVYYVNASDTRLKVATSLRRLGMLITYAINGSRVLEQYLGSVTTDEEWTKSSNWAKIAYYTDVEKRNLMVYYRNTEGETVTVRTVEIPNFKFVDGARFLLKMVNKAYGASMQLKIVTGSGTNYAPLSYNGSLANASNSWGPDTLLDVVWDGTTFQSKDFYNKQVVLSEDDFDALESKDESTFYYTYEE